MNFSGIVNLLKDLAEQTTVTDSDYLPIGGTNLKKISFANLRRLLGIDELNRNKITEVNTYHSVNIVQTGHVKRLCISNSIGLKTTDILTYCTLPVDLRPSFNFFKWVLVSYGVRAYVEVLTTGEVRLSRVSENVPAGTWISVNETYN